MNKRLMRFYLVGLLVLSSAILMVNGCSNNSPISPNNDSIQPSEMPSVALRTSTLLNGAIVLLDPIWVTVAETIDDVEGGDIDIARVDITHVFRVLPNSIPLDTEITIIASKQLVNGRAAIVFEFGPDGLIFSLPSQLDVNMADLNAGAQSARLYYFNTHTNSWEFQEARSVVGGHVVFGISHFSKYAISD